MILIQASKTSKESVKQSVFEKSVLEVSVHTELTASKYGGESLCGPARPPPEEAVSSCEHREP